MDRTAIKLWALAHLPLLVRRAVMCRWYRNEIDVSGEAELPTLAGLIRPGSLTLDIGSNLGTYSYEMARISGRTIAFDPNKRLACFLGSLHIKGLVVRNMAVSDQCGTAELYTPRIRSGHVLASLVPTAVQGVGSGLDNSTVATATVDSLNLERVGFIKIDVEGAEERVLAGAAGTIARDRPTMLIEIEERHNPGALSRITLLLTALGYEAMFYRDGWRPLADFRPDFQDVRALSPGLFKTRRETPYVNNFLFKPTRHKH